MNKYGSSSIPLEITRFLYDNRCFLFRWKGLLKEKKLEMLVDPDLQTNYEERSITGDSSGVALHARLSNGNDQRCQVVCKDA